MRKWIKTGRTENDEGTTIEYLAEGTPVTIESRKRHIPHANREGTWDHTSYFVLVHMVAVKELQSLRDAKQYAERLIEQVERAAGQLNDMAIQELQEGTV